MAYNVVLLRIPDACARWSVGRTRLYELIASGAIIARKAGSRTLVEVASGDAFFARLPRVPLRGAA